jgi:hypothetical protein
MRYNHGEEMGMCVCVKGRNWHFAIPISKTNKDHTIENDLKATFRY